MPATNVVVMTQRMAFYIEFDGGGVWELFQVKSKDLKIVDADLIEWGRLKSYH